MNGFIMKEVLAEILNRMVRLGSQRLVVELGSGKVGTVNTNAVLLDFLHGRYRNHHYVPIDPQFMPETILPGMEDRVSLIQAWVEQVPVSSFPRTDEVWIVNPPNLDVLSSMIEFGANVLKPGGKMAIIEDYGAWMMAYEYNQYAHQLIGQHPHLEVHGVIPIDHPVKLASRASGTPLVDLLVVASAKRVVTGQSE